MKKTLSDIAIVKAGHPFRGKIPEDKEGNAYAVQIRDIDNDGIIQWHQLIRTNITGRKIPDWLQKGDVLMLDTGSTLRGAFCDFDRNFAFGHADDAVKQTHRTLWNATQAGLDAARPGAKASDIFQAMQAVIGGDTGNVGRYGHGLGMQLTEQPSLIDWDQTIMEEGMVITLEPSMPIPGDGQRTGMLVHEENIVIRDGDPQLLTRRENEEIRIL